MRLVMLCQICCDLTSGFVPHELGSGPAEGPALVFNGGTMTDTGQAAACPPAPIAKLAMGQAGDRAARRPPRVLVLGGSPFQLAPIRYARSRGYEVITCDYLPDNPGHRLAHAFHEVSTTDREAVLALARRLDIDGIVAQASDPAAPTAAYVAEALGLPGHPLRSVETLTEKDRYRAHLQMHGFAVPQWRSTRTLDEARQALSELRAPVMVKPVDSSGSKGVSRVDEPAQLAAAWQLARSFSRCGRVLLETWVERAGPQIAGDGYVRDGRLVFHCFAQEHFNPHAGPYTPVGESFPLALPPEREARLVAEIEALLATLPLADGALNFDLMFGADGRVYLMEVAARSGGNLIPEVIRHATGMDLVAHGVDAALGLDDRPLVQTACQGHWAGVVVHAEQSGYFEDLHLSPELDVVERHLFVSPGDAIGAFHGTHNTLGLLILRFDSHARMLADMARMRELVRVASRAPAASAAGLPA